MMVVDLKESGMCTCQGTKSLLNLSLGSRDVCHLPKDVSDEQGKEQQQRWRLT